MLRDEGKWEKFQRISSYILLGCAMGFLVVISGMRFSPKNSIFESALLISGFLILGVVVVMLLVILGALVILDLRELGAKQAAIGFVKTFFVYLGASVLLVFMMALLRNSGFHRGMIREIWLFAIALYIGAYLGKFTKRKLPKE